MKECPSPAFLGYSAILDVDLHACHVWFNVFTCMNLRWRGGAHSSWPMCNFENINILP